MRRVTVTRQRQGAGPAPRRSTVVDKLAFFGLFGIALTVLGVYRVLTAVRKGRGARRCGLELSWGLIVLAVGLASLGFGVLIAYIMAVAAVPSPG